MLSDVRVNEIRTPQRVVLLLRRTHAKMANFAVIPAMRRGARVAESACLESTCAGNGTVGSNPTLSATTSGGVRTGGSEGGVPPSWGDRSAAEARGGRPPSGSVGGGRHATSNSHPLRQISLFPRLEIFGFELNMATIKTTQEGIGYLVGLLKDKTKTITRAIFWKIPHANSQQEDIGLKIGRYNKNGFDPETLEIENPKSELTLDNEEFQKLLEFLSENHEPFKKGIKRYIPIDEKFDQESIEQLKAFFDNPDKQKLLDFVAKNDILPEDLIAGLQNQARINAVEQFEIMLEQDLVEQEWQEWFKRNDWVLGSEFVRILDEREIDTANITDYLMQAYDGFLDIVEIKRPEGNLRFWANGQDHGNYVPSSDLTKAVTQATKYIYEVEREANSVKFLERVDNVKTIKPRCILIFGRSDDWNEDQKEAYRILNSSYHNLTIMTYDHVLGRAKRILGIDER